MCNKILNIKQKFLLTDFNQVMEINNINNQTFGARLGSSAAFRLKNAGMTEMLSQINNKLSKMGETTTVVDIMSSKTSKGRLYSLRLFNEIFGEGYNVSLLKDNHNKDIVSNSPMDLIEKLKDITERTILQKEYGIFNKVAKDHSGSLPMRKYLKGLIQAKKADGKYLSPEIEHAYFHRFI